MGTMKLIPHYTYKDYLQWQGRWELIEGIAIAMSPMANPKHQRIASNLNITLGTLLRNNTCNCQVYQPIDVKIKEDTVVNPDLLIVCEEIEGQFLDRPFPLVVEILSPSTRLKDEVSKFELYESFGIKYYLMIDPKDDSTKLFVLDDEYKYVPQHHFSFDLTDNCTIELKIEDVF